MQKRYISSIALREIWISESNDIYLAHASLCFATAFRSWISALDASCLRSLDVVSRDPIFIVGHRSSGNGGTIRVRHWFRWNRISTLRLSGPISCPFLGRKVRLKPHAVEKVYRSCEATEQEEVEKHADGY